MSSYSAVLFHCSVYNSFVIKNNTTEISGCSHKEFKWLSGTTTLYETRRKNVITCYNTFKKMKTKLF